LSADVLVEASVEIAVDKDVSAELLVEASLDNAVDNELSADVLVDSSTLISLANSVRAPSTLVTVGGNAGFVNSMYCAVIPDGL